MSETLTVGVTGAAGYLGSRVAKTLLDAGHEVVPVDDFSTGTVEAVDGRAVLDRDVRDRDALRAAFDGVDCVVHLAAESGVETCDGRPERAFDVNVGGTENVAWLCRERSIPLAFASSMAVVGDPDSFPITAGESRDPKNLYGRTKAMSEDDVHQLATGAFPAHALVMSNLFGHHRVGGRLVGGAGVVDQFVDLALDGRSLTVHGPGTQARDFLHVEDAARAYLRSVETLVDADAGARTLPLASGEDHTVLDVAEAVRDAVESTRGERVAVEHVENPRSDETAVEEFAVDTGEASAAIGFEAQSDLDGAIERMVEDRIDPGDGTRRTGSVGGEG